MSKQWLEETENLIQSIRQERQVIAQEYEKLGKELAAKDEELSHWEAAVQSYKKHHEIEAPQPSLFLHEKGAYRELSHRDIVLHVRDQNEGNIPMKQTTEIFKHKVENPDHAASVAYSTVARLMKQGKVVKVRPGLYRWVNGTA